MPKSTVKSKSVIRTRMSSLLRSVAIGAVAFVPGESLAGDVVEFAAPIDVVNDTTGVFDAVAFGGAVAIGVVEHDQVSVLQIVRDELQMPSEPFVAIELVSEGVVMLVRMSDIEVDAQGGVVMVFPASAVVSVPEEWTRFTPLDGLVPLMPLSPAFVPEEWTGTLPPVPEEWTSVPTSSSVPEEWTRFVPFDFLSPMSPLMPVFVPEEWTGAQPPVPEEWTSVPTSVVPEEWTSTFPPASPLLAGAEAILRIQ